MKTIKANNPRLIDFCAPWQRDQLVKQAKRNAKQTRSMKNFKRLHNWETVA